MNPLKPGHQLTIAKERGIAPEINNQTMISRGITSQLMKQDYHNTKELPQDTETARLTRRLPLEEIRRVWVELGMYKAGEKFQVSPHVLHYLALKHGWKRPLPEHLEKAYKAGNWSNLKTNYIKQPQTN